MKRIALIFALLLQRPAFDVCRASGSAPEEPDLELQARGASRLAPRRNRPNG